MTIQNAKASGGRSAMNSSWVVVSGKAVGTSKAELERGRGCYSRYGSEHDFELQQQGHGLLRLGTVASQARASTGDERGDDAGYLLIDAMMGIQLRAPFDTPFQLRLQRVAETPLETGKFLMLAMLIGVLFVAAVRLATPPQRAQADTEISEWLLSDDSGRRFAALSLIRDFGIMSTLPALRQLVQRLKKTDGPEARDELRSVEQVVGQLTHV
jgi:hypothetical protein